jgi:hypothetical protein
MTQSRPRTTSAPPLPGHPMDNLNVYIGDALRGNARVRGSAKLLPVYKHFNLHQALDELSIYVERDAKFEDGAVGWSQGRVIAVKPTTVDPVCVAFHEIAHVLLPRRRGRTSARTKAVLEVEVELTAFLVKRCLGSKIHLSRARNYIQSQMKKARPLTPRFELVEKAALEILEAGRTDHRVSPGIAGLGLAIARRDYDVATRSANVFWKERDRKTDDRLPMPTGHRDPLSEDYGITCVECDDDDALFVRECIDELCKRCMRTRLAWERDNGLIRKSEYRNLVRELSARFG